MKKYIIEYQDKNNKEFQDDIIKEAMSEFNLFRLNILANQIKSQHYINYLNKASNI